MFKLAVCNLLQLYTRCWLHGVQIIVVKSFAMGIKRVKEQFAWILQALLTEHITDAVQHSCLRVCWWWMPLQVEFLFHSPPYHAFRSWWHFGACSHFSISYSLIPYTDFGLWQVSIIWCTSLPLSIPSVSYFCSHQCNTEVRWCKIYSWMGASSSTLVVVSLCHMVYPGEAFELQQLGKLLFLPIKQSRSLEFMLFRETLR